jgi:hypothetical protein
MTVYNENWSEWILSSILRHFSSNISYNNESLPIYIESQHKNYNDEKYVEVIVDGPHFDDSSKDYWVCTITICVFISVHITTNLWLLQELQGIVVKAFTDIQIYDSSNNIVSCLSIAEDSEIRIINIGQPEEAQDILRCAVESTYKGEM